MRSETGTRDYACGWDEMDGQHRLLVETFSLLEASPRQRDGDLSGIERIMREMEAHFRWEEDRMRDLGYPDLARHASDHGRQLRNLRDIHLLVAQGMEILDVDFFHACREWNLRHIRGQDFDFAVFVLEREVWELQHELAGWDFARKVAMLPD